MQRYMPTFFQAVGDKGETWAGMREDSDDGQWYSRAEVDARIAELEIEAQPLYSRRQLDERIRELEQALQKIAAFDPGNFRTLEEECEIWRIATTALGKFSGEGNS